MSLILEAITGTITDVTSGKIDFTTTPAVIDSVVCAKLDADKTYDYYKLMLN